MTKYLVTASVYIMSVAAAYADPRAGSDFAEAVVEAGAS